jgi:chromosome segregation ATPase
LLPVVRLEMRLGAKKPTAYEISDLGFLIGSVPGCDLRLPGVNLPPVLCLISRHPAGVVLRKLTPLVPILVNGQPTSGTALNSGDRITLGAIDLLVHVAGSMSAPPSATKPASLLTANGHEKSASLNERERLLKEQAEELEADRAIWYRRRDQLEQECKELSESSAQTARKLQQQERELALARADVTEREQALRTVRVEVEKQYEEIEKRSGEFASKEDELATSRRELADLRQQLYDRYRERRDRLSGIQEAVRKAARKVQERKRLVDAEVARLADQKQDDEARTAKLNELQATLAKERQLLDEQKQLLDSRQQQLHQELSERLTELQEREQAVIEEHKILERSQDEHQSDLVRLDRLQAVMERKQKQLQIHAREVDLRFEQLHRDSRELEEQGTELDSVRTKVLADAEEINQRKEKQDKVSDQLNQRAAALEGQQTMLTTLRTKLERMREDVRQGEGRLAEHQSKQADLEADLQSRLEDAEKIRAELAANKDLHERQRQHFKERQTILDQAVAQLRKVQEALSRDEARLRQREAELDLKATRVNEHDAGFKDRAEQIVQQQERLASDRQALQDREAALSKSEQALAALQEQLRRRSDDLAGRIKEHEQLVEGHVAAATTVKSKAQELETQRKIAVEEVAALNKDLEAQAVELARQRADLAEREETLREKTQRIEETTNRTHAEGQHLEHERKTWQEDQRLVAEDLARQRAELEAARQGTLSLEQQLPRLQEQVASALEKLNVSRANIREHLAEIHGYAQQSRTDLEALRASVLKEADQVRAQERQLHQARDDHRLAVTAFRQQLLDWQSQVNELKQTLVQGHTSLVRRQAEVDEQARQIDSTSQRLTQQAEQLQEQQQEVAERRGEMERHLLDMREWYRRKLRELAGVNEEARSEADSTEDHPGAEDLGDFTSLGEDQDRNILSLTGEIDPGDRQLGALLTSLQLIDPDTLTALLVEARRQRRSLRQLLLSGSYLTLYQMALIEAGNVDGLALGPLRVIDRLRANSKEIVYRVFDPRSNQEAVLRHLSEAAMHDPDKIQEFRRRFREAAALRHPSLTATWEVLDISGRPGVLQEFIPGLSSNEWPALAAAPGVWYRLLSQSALGLHAAHQAGMVHGHLQGNHVMLSHEGVVKLSGFGEPDWLAHPPYHRIAEPNVKSDIAALGKLAAAWSSPGQEAKRGRAKPLPTDLQNMLNRLGSSEEDSGYQDAAALLEDLDKAGATVPANSSAWERFIKQVSEQSSAAKPAKRSA